jgi:hypothetical protein
MEHRRQLIRFATKPYLSATAFPERVQDEPQAMIVELRVVRYRTSSLGRKSAGLFVIAGR